MGHIVEPTGWRLPRVGNVGEKEELFSYYMRSGIETGYTWSAKEKIK